MSRATILPISFPSFAYTISAPRAPYTYGRIMHEPQVQVLESQFAQRGFQRGEHVLRSMLGCLLSLGRRSSLLFHSLVVTQTSLRSTPLRRSPSPSASSLP
jgi:hypothetical protein